MLLITINYNVKLCGSVTSSLGGIVVPSTTTDWAVNRREAVCRNRCVELGAWCTLCVAVVGVVYCDVNIDNNNNEKGA